MKETASTGPGRPVVALLLAALLSLLVVKALLAGLVPLFGDEAFYWLESRHPALAYSDLPLMTALLTGIGTTAAGESYIGVRMAFLALGAALPWLVYRLGLRLADRRDALLAAAATCCVPLAATLGLLALPDVPLTLFALAGLLAACRAQESDRVRWWLLAGACAALGLATHYRFLVWVAGPAAWLLLSRDGRRCWRGAGPWVAALVALVGMMPLAWFNLRHDMAGVAFQFLDRHPWSWQPDGWRFIATQVMVVTPLMFLAMAAGVRHAWRYHRHRPCVALALWFSLLPMALLALAAFFADSERTSAHWPLAAYLPLLAWLPGALREWPGWLRRLAPVTGLAGTLALLGWLAIAAWPGVLGGITGNKAFPDNFTGWREAGARTARFLEDLSPAPGLVVAGNFMLGAELSFELGGERVHSLDHVLNTRHGRALQLRLWGLDEAVLLQRHAGEAALVVLEDTALKIADQPGWARRLCTRFDELRFLDEQVLYQGRKRFLYFHGRVRGEPAPAPDSPLPTSRCDLPPFAYLALPLDGDAVRHPMAVLGWAVEDNAGVASVTVLLDGRELAGLDYGTFWDDVARFLPGSVDPNHPQVGFNQPVSLEGVAPGEHAFALRVVTRDGNVRVLENRRIKVVE